VSADAVHDAYRAYRRLQHSLRMGGAEYARVPLEDMVTHKDAVLALWRLLLG
jgi:glutamate-ammonia-ligase adenylyltransferase